MSAQGVTTELAEWDWVYTRTATVLHHAAVFDDPDDDAYDEHGVTTCGVRTWLSIPGVFSRMGLRRCKRCCAALGIPEGKGSPKNDLEFGLPLIVESRIERLRQQGLLLERQT